MLLLTNKKKRNTKREKNWNFVELFSQGSVWRFVVEGIDGNGVLVLLVFAAVQVDVVRNRSVDELIVILKKVNERIREHGKVELEHKEHQEFEDKVLRSCDCLKIIVILLTMVAWVVGAGTCNNAWVRGVWMLLRFKTSNSPEKLSTTKVLLQTEIDFLLGSTTFAT